MRRFRRPRRIAGETDDACHTEPNLTKRCGCKYRHVSVEPAAAYWGRWSEQGSSPYIAEAQSDAYLAFDPNCGPEGRQRGSTRCRLHYINEIFAEDDARKPYEGYLRSYLFSNDLGEQNGSYGNNIEEGPQGMAQNILDPWMVALHAAPLSASSSTSPAGLFDRARQRFKGS